MNVSTKKIIIIIFVIVAVAVALFLFVSMKKSSQQTTEQENTVQNIPTLPEAQIAKSPNLSEIKKSAQEEINNTQNNSIQISEKSYKNNSGQLIGLDDFVAANEMKIETGVLQNASQKDYATFSCADGKNLRPAVGLMLQLRRDVDPKKYQQSYPDMEKNMRNWEKTIFQDFFPLFFPGESFSKEPVFVETKYTTSNKANIISIRFANLTAASGKQYSIDWGFLNDQIFISNDKDCLRRELDKNADAYER